MLVYYPYGSREDKNGNILPRHAEWLPLAQFFLSVDGTMEDYKGNPIPGHAKGKTFTADGFMRWAKEQLIPNLPKDRFGRGCLVYFDNAAIHSVDISDFPRAPKGKSYVSKKQWVEWFERVHPGVTIHNGHKQNGTKKYFKVDMLKAMANERKPNPMYEFDTYLLQHGHIPMRTPPYNPK